MSDESEKRANSAEQGLVGGVLGYFVHNRVASNLALLLLVVGGLLTISRIRQEAFPAFDLDTIEVKVGYPSASPEEVEQGVVLAVEEAVRGVDGVKDVIATAKEGLAVVRIELLLGADESRALSDIKGAVDRITSFPLDAEEPAVRLLVREEVPVSLVVTGDVPESTLRDVAEQTRDRLLQDDRLTRVELRSPPAREISIEIPQASLRAYGLTLQQVAQTVRASSVELPGGAVKTRAGEVLVRTSERKNLGQEFAEIVVASRPDGTVVRVRDLGVVKDGFQEDGPVGSYNGKRAVMIDLYRVGDESPLTVAAALDDFIASNSAALPKGVSYATWGSLSKSYKGRIQLLANDGWQGLILVMLVLGAFLNARLAFWVWVGIPTSFLGSILLMPLFNVSFNMVSLFGFIIVLGMLVDDAIVIGEAAYHRYENGEPMAQAAVNAVRDMAIPVVCSVLTTTMSFSPLLMVPGVSGKFLRNIPLVVIMVLIVSLFETLLFLPAHLAHAKTGGTETGFLRGANWVQRHVNMGLNWFIDRVYSPILYGATRRRVLTLAVAIGACVATIGLMAGGRVKFTFMPVIEGDVIDVFVRLPFDAPRAETEAVVHRIEEAAYRTAAKHGARENTIRGMFSAIGIGGNHLANISLEMPPMGERPIGSDDFKKEWQAMLGEVVGVETVSFESMRGPGGGKDIDVELSHQDMTTLESAASELAQGFEGYAGVLSVDDGLAKGKQQLNLKLTPEALSLGLTPADIGRQLRGAFFGEEAVRQQRARNEVRVYVRRPRDERSSENDIERFLVRTRDAGEMPLTAAASMERGRAYTEIERRNGRRIIHVSADLDTAVANANEVVAGVSKKELKDIAAKYAGLSYDFGSGQRGQRETVGSLATNYPLVLLGIYVMLAIAFKSYWQPLPVMIAIPFGWLGAILGHAIMGYTLSLISIMGIVALTGVVVNSSLVLIDGVNDMQRSEGLKSLDAIRQSSLRRFRPIMLTSATTFLGLLPMLTETSAQARFLIPMAISLAFGIFFSTALSLLVVPAGFLVVEELVAFCARVYHNLMSDDDPWDKAPRENPAE